MIADLFRQLEDHFYNSDVFAALRIAVLIVVGLYLLSFLAIWFVILVYRKAKRDRCSNVPATASAMLAATFFWPASVVILLNLFGPAKVDPVELRDVVDLFRLWGGIMLFFTPISTVMGGLLLILYLTRKKQMSPRTIYMSVSSIMFLQCVYINAFLFVLGSK